MAIVVIVTLLILVGVSFVAGLYVGAHGPEVEIIKEPHDECSDDCPCFGRGYESGLEAGKNVRQEGKGITTVLPPARVKPMWGTVLEVKDGQVARRDGAQQARLKNLEKARLTRQANLVRKEEIKQTRLKSLKKARRALKAKRKK